MQLTEDSDLEDVLTSYRTRTDSFVFGTMFRLMQPDNTGVIPNTLDNQEQVTYNDIMDLNAGEEEAGRSVVVIKDTYSFLIKGDYLITDLPGNINIDRLETYLNWLLESSRDGQLIKYNCISRIPNDLPLKDIKSIEIAPDIFVNTEINQPVRTILTGLSDATGDLFRQFSGSNEAIQGLRENDLLGYKLILYIKGKPKEMTKERYERMLSSSATASAFEDGVKLHTSTRGVLSRDKLFEKKTVQVEFIDGRRMNFRSLELQMEQFLNEVQRRDQETA